MKRREMLKLAGAALGLSLLPGSGRLWAQNAKRKILYFTRSQTFIHPMVKRNGDELSVSEQVLTDLGKQHDVDVICSKDGRLFDGDLSQYAAIAFYTSGDLTQPGGDNEQPMSAAGKQKLLDAIAGGLGFVGIHSATDSFHPASGATDPYLAMLGGEFIGHGRQQDTPNLVVSPNFPGVEKMGKAFQIKEEWYTFDKFADDLHVILVQDTTKMSYEGGSNKERYDRPPYPATWARKQGQGRVFYTSLGHNETVWRHPAFQELLVGGFAWVMRDAEADITPNMDQVTPKARQLHNS